MLTEIYIEALLVDEDQADQVWELWDIGMMSNDFASAANRTGLKLVATD